MGSAASRRKIENYNLSRIVGTFFFLFFLNVGLYVKMYHSKDAAFKSHSEVIF